MFIATHDHCALAGKRTGKKFVVIWISTDRLVEALRRKHRCLDRNQFYCWPQVNPRELFCQGFPYSSVFIKYFRGDYQLPLTIAPSFKNFIGRSSKKNTRNKNIRVEDYPHFLPRTLATASVISECFRPAFLPCWRASAINASNSFIDGEDIALRITTSSSPTTTNWEPVLNLSRLRISSGMTTWPLEDIFVVAKFAIV